MNQILKIKKNQVTQFLGVKLNEKKLFFQIFKFFETKK